MEEDEAREEGEHYGRSAGNSDAAEARRAMLKLIAACASREPIDFSEHTRAKWTMAISRLFRFGRLEATEYAARSLLEAYPDYGWVRRMCEIFDVTPPAGPDLIPFSDVLDHDVQIAPCAGADTVIIAFCDIRHHLGLPLMAAHRWLGALGASVIYLRDFYDHLYLSGVASLGTTRAAALSRLRESAAALGARRIVCCGNSSGVLPALHYGLDLGAESVLGFAAPITRLTDTSRNPSSATFVRDVIKAQPIWRDLDMRLLYRSAKQPPRFGIVYGDTNSDDRQAAEYMRDLPGANLIAVKDYNAHDALIESVRRQALQPMLEWLVRPSSADHRGLASLPDSFAVTAHRSGGAPSGRPAHQNSPSAETPGSRQEARG